ncbi:MAG: ABC transporter permease [Lachnospiraceae bacterium]|nr:ABC transporter permease [Lachnospiraceae bacterium]
MLRLIKIEFTKLFSKKLFYISLGACLLAVIAFAAFLKADFETEKDEELAVTEQKREQAKDWKEKLEAEIEINNYYAGVYGEEKTEAMNALLRYQIDHDIKPYGKNTTWDFVQYLYAIMGFALILAAVVIAADSMNYEFSSRTVKTLFVKPYSRAMIIGAKYIAVLLEIALLLVITSVFAFVVGGVAFDFGGAGAPAVMGLFGKVYGVSFLGKTLVCMTGFFLKMSMAATIAFFLSMAFKNQLISVIAGFGIVMFGNMITNKLYDFGWKWVKFSILSNSDLASFVDNYLKQHQTMLSFALVFALHLAAFVVASIVICKKSDY